MTTLILSGVALITMFIYLGILLSNWKISSKHSKRKMIFCLVLVGLCITIAFAYVFEGKTSSGLIWFFNSALWLLNYYLNLKSYINAKQIEESNNND